ncbi:hypothetical protein OZL92_09510 [Bacillus sonorensis]|uniref:hypothetical protein n=1 Tax=Bacillus TaxID=1386 RepID=UPI0011408ECA|nr:MULTISPECIES: hypothetical protein [Bacillus]MCF7616579.1 hypothetical protein [Bacillus sonorensis]MCY8605158.1 hypothetical protein [Bacillus sonorensis]MCZ0068723.1 hypothetical protein [Bacillus sonorensis]MCZ0073005.1 hypothetical protein [Bacillus sonorensis]MCZ0091626.1 hypothetical protein [Bacillus sonorensis]
MPPFEGHPAFRLEYESISAAGPAGRIEPQPENYDPASSVTDRRCSVCKSMPFSHLETEGL